MLLPRLITAVAGIPLVLLSIYWGGIPFFILMTGVVVLALREYIVLAGTRYAVQPAITMVTGVVLFLFLFLNGTTLGPLAENQGTPAFLSVMLIALFAREMFRSKIDRAIENVGVSFLGAFFIPWAMGHLLLLRSIRPGGMAYVYTLFVTIWMLDTGAYAIGKKFGKRRLAELVSPKKTIEGFIGGTVTGMVTALACRQVWMRDLVSIPEVLLLGLAIAVIAQFSDLAESLIKRDVGVKDSANLLPGHGGMLDRFDSFLFTAPFLYYYLTMFKGN